MRIGGIGMVYPTYVYNPNTVSAKSMNKLSRISDDVLDKKVDYSETVAKENENPLRKGQTLDFEGILAKQMQQGQNRAARIIKAAPEQEEASATAATSMAPAQKQETAAAFVQKKTASVAGSDTEAAASVMADNNTSVMQMQRAIQAYEMSMTA